MSRSHSPRPRGGADPSAKQCGVWHWFARGLWLAAGGAVLAAALLLACEPYAEAHEALPEALRPFRPLPIRLLNALNVAAAALGRQLVDLNADSLLSAACSKFVSERGDHPPATACDWGDSAWDGQEWREGFGVLVQV